MKDGMVYPFIESSLTFGITEYENRCANLVKKGKKFNVDGLDIGLIIGFLNGQNFRVSMPSAKKDVELYQGRLKVRERTSEPIEATFGEHYQEKILQYTLPVTNEGHDESLDERIFNHPDILIRNHGAFEEPVADPYIAWTLALKDTSADGLKRAVKMMREFGSAVYRFHMIDYVSDGLSVQPVAKKQ